MTSEAAVTVVMAAYNSARTIGQAIGSVLLQTREDWELVVVDDGSTDDTVAVASSFGDARIRIVRGENGGPAVARNAGIAAARTPLVSLLDSDDLWLPGYLATMTALLAADPDAVLAYTDAWVLDDATGRVRKTTEMTYQRPPVPPPAAPRAFLVELMKRNFIYNSVTARREALVEVGGYDERLRTSEDWELWLRLAALGRPCLRAPEALAVHRDHRGSLTTDLAELRRSDQAVYRIVQDDWKTDDEIRALARTLAAEGRGGRSRLDLGVARLVRPVRRRLQRRTLWHRRPPTEIARLLAAVSGR